MSRIAQPVILSEAERHSLTALLARGKTTARCQTRAHVLDLLHRGAQPKVIADTLQISQQTVFNLKRRYRAEGLEAALTDKPRSGKPARIDGAARAKITALACSDAPEGHARWTLRLLADHAVERHWCDGITPKTVHGILKKTNSSRT